jgi:Pentapeptide repeats (8 copies)
MHRPRGALAILAVLAIAGSFFALAVIGPLWLPAQIEPTFSTSPATADGAQLRIGVRKSVLDWLQTCFGALTAAGLIGTLFYTAKSYRVAAENLRVTEYSKFSEAFGKAMEALADPGIPVRVGGIHALGRLALGSRADHARIIGLLCDHLRQTYPHTLDVDGAPADPPSEPPADTQAALDVIRKRNALWDEDPIDLSRCCLSGASLQDTKLRAANLSHSDLRGVRLEAADLRQADLSDSFLSFANGRKVQLRKAVLRNAELESASFPEADLRGIDLTGARGTIVCTGARLGWFWRRKYRKRYPHIKVISK